MATWPYYFLVLGTCAALDAFVVVIPIDGLIITAIYANPRRWILTAFSTAIGSTLGSAVLAACVHRYGMNFIRAVIPSIEHASAWASGKDLIEDYGDWAVFLTGLLPMAQQPTAILTALAKMPLVKFSLWLFCGRLVKYLIVGGVAAKAPHLVNKLWGVKKELSQVKKNNP